MRIGEGLLGLLARNLAAQDGRLIKTLRNLSSGLRVNTAADDVGSLGRSELFRARVYSTRMAMRNLSQGLSLVGTADGAIREIRTLLGRAHQLAVQSANGTLTDPDRGFLQLEIVRIREAIDEIANNTTFNGLPIFGYNAGFAYRSVNGMIPTDNFSSNTLTNLVTTTAVVGGGSLQLPYTVRPLLNDSFTSTTNIDFSAGKTDAVIDTAGGRALLPLLLAAAASDSFSDGSKINAALTTAVLNTASGVVELSKILSTRLSDTFTSTTGTNMGATTAQVNTGDGLVQQPFIQNSLFSDTFTSMAGIDSALTDALIDTALGLALLPTNFTTGITDSFGTTAKTDIANTTALVDTAAGVVRVGQMFNLWTTDSFNDTSKVSAATTATVDTVNGWATLPVVSSGLWNDTFTSTTNVNGVSTTANVNTGTGDVNLPIAYGTVKTDTFPNMTQVNTLLTNALVDTAAGLVQLDQVYNSLQTDTFADGTKIAANTAFLDTVNQWVTLPVVTQSLWTDTFTSTTLVNGSLTTATVDTTGGRILLPQLFGVGKTDTFSDSLQIAGGTALRNAAGQLIEMSKVLNSRFTDSFMSTVNTSGLTTAFVDTANGWVTAASTTALLKSDTFTTTTGTDVGSTTASVNTSSGWVQMPGTPPTPVTLGTDTFTSTTNVDPSSTVTVNTGTGTASLTTQSYTVASDTFATTSQVDLANTTATLSGGQYQLPWVTVTQPIATETFTSTTNIDGGQTTAAVNTGPGTVTLTTTQQTVATDTFTDGAQVDWTQSSGIHLTTTGDLELGPTALTNNKYDPNAGTPGVQSVFTPTAGANGFFDSNGVFSTSVVQVGTNLEMYYVAQKKANPSQLAVGKIVSTDGGLTWVTPGTQTNITEAQGLTTSDQIDVFYNGTSYTMFERNGGSIKTWTSADGLTWSGGTALTITGGAAATGRPSIIQDDAGVYHLFYQTAGGIAHATSATINGTYTATGALIAGTEPEMVKETLAAGQSQYALYTRDGSGQIVRQTTTDFVTYGAATAVVTTEAGFASSAVHVGGAVYDQNTAVTKMLYYGTSGTLNDVGLAYTTGQVSGTLVTKLVNSTDTINNLQLAATQNVTGGTITYQVSADNGTTWTTVTNGGSVAVAPGKNVLLKAALTNTSGNISGGPILSDYTLKSNLYTSPEQVVSTQYTFAKPTDNVTLQTNQTTPAGTSVAYYYSTDGTTYNAMTPGVQVNLGTPSATFYVKAVLTTTDRGLTPTLSDWTLNTNVSSYQGPKTVTTQNYTFTDSIKQFNLADTQTTPSDSGIQWQYSIDNGATWTNAAIGSNTLGAPVQQLKLRAILTASTDGLFTPQIDDYTVTATRYVSPETLTSTNYTFGTAVNQITVNATQTTPAGTGIAYEISTDNGMTWQAVTLGTQVSVASTTQVKLRATFSASDRYYAPTLSDYTISGVTVGYPTTTTWLSTVTNPGYTVKNVTLNVNESNDAGSSIAYSISTDGGTTFQAITPGSNVALASPGSDLVLKAVLNSTDPAATPRLLDYSLNTDIYQNNTQWVSNTFTTPYNATAVKITATEVKPAGTDIAYEVSSDGGTSWTNVTNGVITNLGTAGSDLRIRATFTATDPNLAAQLQDITLETYDYNTSDTFQSTYTTTANLVDQIQFQVNDSKPGGTGIAYEVTNDGGTTWQAVTNGATVTFGSLGNKIGMRATLTGTGAATPQILDYTLMVPGYQTGKYVYSTAQTTASPVTNVTLSANTVTPAGTGITYEISTDGGTSWTSVTNGANTVVPSGTNLVFRALLQTSDPAYTPELLDYALTTNANQSGSTMTTTTLTTVAPVRYLKLNVNETRPSGTNIIYELSNNGGASWVTVTPGTDVDMGAFGSQVLMRATFNTTDPQNLMVPKLLDYSIQAKEYAASRVFYSDYSAIATPITEIRLQANQTLPASTGIAYEVTNDGGTTWQAVAPGTSAIFGSAGSSVGLRATLTSNGESTPQLLDYTLEVPGYVTGKYLYSTVQNQATPITNVTFNANATTPASTSIGYEVSTDGGTTWQAITSGVNQAVTSGTQLVFRALLQTTDPAQTPTLHDYSFATNVDQSGKQLVSTVTTTTQPVRYLRLGVTESKPASTNITYQLSNDGGTTWVAATPGTIVDMGTWGTQLRMRATFSTTDPTRVAVPKLLDYQIESQDYAPTQQFQSTVRTLINPATQVRLAANATTPAGTSITYYASGDGGANWDAITPGVVSNLTTSAGTQLVFKAVMNTNGQATPVLSDYTLEVPGYAAPKYVYSTNHVYGTPITNVNLAVTANTPAGTGMTYQVSGDGGTTWQTVTAGANTVLSSPTTQLAFRAKLDTTDPNYTPQLLDYALTTNANTSGSVWYSNVAALSSPATVVKLTSNEFKPIGTDILYEVSADNGTNWQAVTPGSETTLTNPGTQLLMRATFSSTDPAQVQTAQLLDYTLETRDYATSEQVQSSVFTLGQNVNQILINSSEVKPSGTNIQYEVSMDGGTTWDVVPQGVSTTLTQAAGNQLVMRATLTSSGQFSPQLFDYTISVPGYTQPKWVYSTVQNVAPVYNVNLAVGDTRPAGTRIMYQVTADNGTTWATVTPGVDTMLAAGGTQVAIRAMLETANYTQTPEIQDWTLTTKDYSASKIWQSVVFNQAIPVEIGRIDSNGSVPPGTSIDYQISNDGGTTWYNATPGMEVFFATPGSDMVARATLNSPAGGTTPVIDSYSLYSRDPNPTYLPRQFWIQAGSEAGDGLWVSVDAMEAIALGFDRVDISTQNKAMTSITQVDQAINKVTTGLARLGAAANKLEHAQNTAMVVVETASSALSRIRDADMAYETTELVKSQLLMRGGTAVLDQALTARRQQLVVLLSTPNLIRSAAENLSGGATSPMMAAWQG